MLKNIFFALAIAFACLTAAQDRATAQTRAQIFLPTSTIGWGFYLAEKKGFFKDAGIDANIRVFSSGNEAGQAFQSVKADVLEAGDMPTLALVDRMGGDAVIVAQVARSEQAIQLIGPTTIRGPADLKGKKIATIFGATNEYYIRKYVKENGLEGQVTIINLDPGSQVPALLRGDVDAIVTFLSFGVRLLQDSKYHTIAAWGSSLMLAVSKRFVDSEPATVEKILRVLQRSAEVINADPKAAVAAVAGDHGVVEKAYEDDLGHGGIDVYPKYPPSTHSFLQGVSAFLVDQGRLKAPFDFCKRLDLSFLKKINPQAASGAPTCP
jgi:ABC-type nitrate/sulfonate/bicarbonate transport system substrate-binding protein